MTLIFLLRRTEGEISHICLAMKKFGFGEGKWNGTGGKVEPGESVEDAARREAREEIGVNVQNMHKFGELTFRYVHDPSWNQLVHAYFCEAWEGEPAESDEMRPQWFRAENIPWDRMWPDDRIWLPEALRGRKFRAHFTLGEGDIILEKDVQTVESF